MKRNFSLTMLLALLAFTSFGCGRTAETNLNSGLTTNKNVAAEPLNTASIEAELLKLEKEWVGAVKSRDAETIRRILADDIILTYPDGVRATKNEEVQAVETGVITAESWEVVDTKVTVLNADSAFITGKGIVKNGFSKDPKGGKPIDISGEYYFLDVYAKRNGRWQAVASQTTPIRKQQ
jgi:ketosteroid isomerase-like protein